MRIKIGAELRPFSHSKEVDCLIPGTLCPVKIFPTLVRYEGKEYKLPIQGPVRDFTVILDLEKGYIEVFGHAANGFKRYYIFMNGREVVIDFKKPKRDEMQKERLSLGFHRLQDWEMIARRANMGEIFPIWFALAQQLPEVEEGEAYLLKQIEVAKEDKSSLLDAFARLFHAHFKGLLVPRVHDDHHQGLIPEEEILPLNTSPFFLLKQSGALIRSLFIEEGEEIALLPFLPPEFHAGRFIDIRLKNGDRLDMEWSKKKLRRLIWRPTQDRVVFLKLPKEIDSFRTRHSLKEKGEMTARGSSLLLHAGQMLYLDRFQK